MEEGAFLKEGVVTGCKERMGKDPLPFTPSGLGQLKEARGRSYLQAWWALGQK